MHGYSFNIIFSKRCNQQCYYCDVWSQHIENYKTCIDINRLNEVLDMFPIDNLTVRINGGEPGILENIEEGIDTLLSHPKVKNVAIYSNGTVRYKGFKFIDYNNVFYQEHLILDIDDKHINKFFEMDFDPAYKYVIILANKTTNSLLKNYAYFKDMGLFNNNFYFKILVNKTISCRDYINDIEKLINKIADDTGRSLSFARDVIDRIKNNKDDIMLKKTCSSFPYNMYIDFERNVIGHCTMVTSKTSTYPLNKENINRNLKGLLFNEDDACKDCYTYESNTQIIKNVLAGKLINYIYEDYITFNDILW